MSNRAALIAVVSAGVLVAAAAGAEVTVRVRNVGAEARRARLDSLERDLRLLSPCATIQQGPDGKRVVAASGAARRAFDYPLEQKAGSLRVAVVGEASAVELGVAMKALVERSPGSAVEVLNCASSVSSLEHAARRAKEVLRYSPDVLVVAFGHDLEAQYPMDAWRLRLEDWLRHSRLVDAALAALSAPEPPTPVDVAERIASLSRWLRELASEARTRGTTVIVQTLASNLWVPPLATPDALGDEQFLEARLEYARGERVAAMQRLARRAGERNDPYWHFVLGTWLARSGDRKRARDHLQAAVDLSTLETDRASSAVNQAIRRAAEEDSLVLRDTEAVISALARQGIPGWDAMRDHRELKPHLFEAEAREILLLARRAVGPDKPLALATPSAPQPSPDDIKRGLGVLTRAVLRNDGETAERWAHALGYAVEQWLALDYDGLDAAVDEYLERGTFARIRDPQRRACVLTALAAGYWNGGRTERARELSDRALSEPSAEARTERALLELSRGRMDTARELLGDSLALETDRTDARFFLDRLAPGRAAAHRTQKRRVSAT